MIENAGVPAWWPAWCLAYDVGAAAGLAWLLRRGLTTNAARASSLSGHADCHALVAEYRSSQGSRVARATGAAASCNALCV